MFWNIKRMVIASISMLVIANVSFIYVSELMGFDWILTIVLELGVICIGVIVGFVMVHKESKPLD